VTEIRFHITGMHCQSCAALIEEELKEMDGVSTIKVDFGSGEAVIAFDEHTVSLKRITEKISELGYAAHLDS